MAPRRVRTTHTCRRITNHTPCWRGMLRRALHCTPRYSPARHRVRLGASLCRTVSPAPTDTSTALRTHGTAPPHLISSPFSKNRAFRPHSPPRCTGITTHRTRLTVSPGHPSEHRLLNTPSPATLLPTAESSSLHLAHTHCSRPRRRTVASAVWTTW